MKETRQSRDISQTQRDQNRTLSPAIDKSTKLKPSSVAKIIASKSSSSSQSFTDAVNKENRPSLNEYKLISEKLISIKSNMMSLDDFNVFRDQINDLLSEITRNQQLIINRLETPIVKNAYFSEVSIDVLFMYLLNIKYCLL